MKNIITLFILFIFIITYRSCHFHENLDNKTDRKPSKSAIYDSNNYSVQYHDSVDMIESRTSDGSWLLNNGKVEYVPWSKIASFVTYNKPGSFEYGSASYVPSYKDSIYLSRSNN